MISCSSPICLQKGSPSLYGWLLDTVFAIVFSLLWLFPFLSIKHTRIFPPLSFFIHFKPFTTTCSFAPFLVAYKGQLLATVCCTAPKVKWPVPALSASPYMLFVFCWRPRALCSEAPKWSTFDICCFLAAGNWGVALTISCIQFKHHILAVTPISIKLVSIRLQNTQAYKSWHPARRWGSSQVQGGRVELPSGHTPRVTQRWVSCCSTPRGVWQTGQCSLYGLSWFQKAGE